VSSIFISYASIDGPIATRLRDLLVERGYATVFRDKDPQHGIPPGTKWLAELVDNVERTDVVVFLTSAASIESRWCHTELTIAVANGKHIIPVQLEAAASHPLLADRQTLPPIADPNELVSRIVEALSRVGFGPGEGFSWDSDRSPYPGLRRLDADYAAVLFGRDAEVRAALQRLAIPRPLPLFVTGPSGCGKSSLIRAGVLPRLRRQKETLVLPIVEPGDRPLQRILLAFETGGSPASDLTTDHDGLAAAVDRLVANGASRVVLFIDQAEDLVARARRPEVGDLVERLRRADPDRLIVIAAVRSASLDAWLQEPNLAWLAQADPLWVRPLVRSSLREVILGPAQRAGITFESPQLVERILDDTGEGNALPLLATLLEELAEGHSRLSPAVITSAQYDVVGPVAAVIERRARAASDDIRARRGVAERDVVDAYIRLVEIGGEAQVTAAEVDVDELPLPVREIFDDLERHRLVVRDRHFHTALGDEAQDESGDAGSAVGTVAAIHEEVFRSWPAVATAINGRRTDLEIRTWLRRDTRTWEESGRGSASLSGGRLTIARDWAERNQADVTPAVRDYLRSAVGQLRRRRALTVAVPILAAIIVVIGGLALRAIAEADRASAARDEADALRIAGDARAAFDTRLDLGLLLALEAAQRSDDLQVRGALLAGLTHGPGPRRIENVGQLDFAALDGAGHHAVLQGEGDHLVLWDVDIGREVGTLPSSMAFAISRDGSTIAVAQQGAITFFSWPQAQPRLSCAFAFPTIAGLAMSKTGDYVVVITEDPDNPTTVETAGPSPGQVIAGGLVVVALRAAGCELTSLTQVPEDIYGVAVDAEGDRVAITSAVDGGALWRLSTGDRIAELRSGRDVSPVVFGSDARVAGGGNGEVLLWGANAPEANPQRIRIAEAGRYVSVITYSTTDDDLIVTGMSNGEVRLVRPNEEPIVGPRLVALPDLELDPISTGDSPLAVGLQGMTAVTINVTGRVVKWDLEGRPPLGPHLLDGRFINTVAPLHDGSVLTADPSGVYVLDGQDGRLVRNELLGGEQMVTAVGVAPRGWAVGTSDGEILVPNTGAAGLRSIARLPGPVVGIISLGDESWAAAWRTGLANEGGVAVVDESGARQDAQLGFPTALVSSSESIFVSDLDGLIWRFEATDLSRPPSHVATHELENISGGPSAMAISADGSQVATAGFGVVVLWDVGPGGQLSRQGTLLGHQTEIKGLSFSPDGHWLASTGEDGQIFIWNLDVKTQVGDPIDAHAQAAAFSLESDRQLYVAGDGLDRWDMRSEMWPKMACDLLGSRTLVAVERERFLRGEDARAKCL
jgi:WD40 repeat protein